MWRFVAPSPLSTAPLSFLPSLPSSLLPPLPIWICILSGWLFTYGVNVSNHVTCAIEIYEYILPCPVILCSSIMKSALKISFYYLCYFFRILLMWNISPLLIFKYSVHVFKLRFFYFHHFEFSNITCDTFLQFYFTCHYLELIFNHG